MRGDEAEFTAWALGVRPRLLRTATALAAGDHHLAEDLVQTALTRTFVAWSRVRIDERRGEHPDRYVHQVLVRAFVDETRRPWWRRERGVAVQPTDAETLEPLAVSDPDPHQGWAIRDALDTLPPEQRAVVVLRYWLGSDVEETARLLRCPPATVRSRALRGLTKLRELLRDDDLEPTPGSRP